MKLRYLIILFFVALFTGCEKKSSHQTPSNHGDVSHILQTMPEQDRNALEHFFQHLSSNDEVAYTLFGNKPMTMICYSSKANSWDLYHPSKFLTLEKGWKVWQSYASLFPSDEFVLKRCTKEHGQSDIFLINKRHALQVISDNLDTFQMFLDPHIEPQGLLQQLCYSEQDIYEIINNNSALVGILLGYGKINAMDFAWRITLCRHLNEKMTPPFSAYDEIKFLSPMSRIFVNAYNILPFSYPSKEYFPSSGNASLSEELNELFFNRDFFDIYGSHDSLNKINSPVFAIRKDSAETKKLHKDYLATKQKVDQVYLHDSFLEITLNQWMYPQ